MQAILSLTSLTSLAALALSIPTVRESPLSTVHYALFFLTQIVFLHLTTYNHHTSRRSSTLILLFWPVYLLISAVRLRTMILTGELSLDINGTTSGRITLAREALWIATIGLGLVDLMLELFSPEKRWKKFKLLGPWQKEGKIKLDDSDEEDEAANGVDAVNGGGAVPSKTEDGVESPVVTANIYERLTFSWLTRECSAERSGIALTCSYAGSRDKEGITILWLVLMAVPRRGGHVEFASRRFSGVALEPPFRELAETARPRQTG